MKRAERCDEMKNADKLNIFKGALVYTRTGSDIYSYSYSYSTKNKLTKFTQAFKTCGSLLDL